MTTRKDGRENCTDRAFLSRHANAVSEVETITNTSRTAREIQVTKHKTCSPHTQKQSAPLLPRASYSSLKLAAYRGSSV